METLRIFDTHCHLADEKLIDHTAELFKSAAESGIEALTIISADVQNVRSFPELIPQLKKQALEISPKLSVYHSSGLHPHEADHFSEALAELICAELKGDAVAVGETGLDYHYDFSDRTQQKKVFTQHIDWSAEFDKPLVIHCREAAADMLTLLDRSDIKAKDRPGILHCFTEDMTTAKSLLDLGFYISFSGIVTFNNADSLREVARHVPLDRLLIETDSPYLAPKPNRGKQNQPAFLKHIFDFVSELRSESREELAEALWKNSEEVFGL